MNDTDFESSLSALHNRLTQIETVLAHLQQDMDSVNTALSGHFRRLQVMDERFSRIEHEIQIAGQTPEKRDPDLERPPHY
jgi:uncharacterized coiled-coil protein SlyX